MASASSGKGSTARQRQSTLELEANTHEMTTSTTGSTITSPPNAVIIDPQTVVKITPWRLLNTIFVLGVGIEKAVLAYRGQSTVPTTLDWVMVVLWVVVSYWLSILELERPSILHWFLQNDLNEQNRLLGNVLPIVGAATFLGICSAIPALTIVAMTRNNNFPSGLAEIALIYVCILLTILAGGLVASKTLSIPAMRLWHRTSQYFTPSYWGCEWSWAFAILYPVTCFTMGFLITRLLLVVYAFFNQPDP